MLLADLDAIDVKIKTEEVGPIQRTFRMCFCHYEQGIHMVFDSRYLAEAFAHEYMGISKNYRIVKVSAENGKNLGYEIVLQFALVADIGDEEEEEED